MGNRLTTEAVFILSEEGGEGYRYSIQLLKVVRCYVWSAEKHNECDEPYDIGNAAHAKRDQPKCSS